MESLCGGEKDALLFQSVLSLPIIRIFSSFKLDICIDRCAFYFAHYCWRCLLKLLIDDCPIFGQFFFVSFKRFMYNEIC